MKTINFKITLKNNENVFLKGYVNIDEIDDEEPLNWFEKDGMEYNSNFPKNPVMEESNQDLWEDYEVLRNSFFDDDLFLQFLADFAEENKLVDRGDYLLKINGGAKMECGIKEIETDSWHPYVVELIPKFNCERLYLAEFMEENGITFDPYGGCDEHFNIEKGHIYFEISKDWFEGDDEDKKYNLKVINSEARSIFARYLVEEAKIGALFGDTLEQCLDDETDEDWLFRFMTAIKEDSVKELLDSEGYEYPSE